MLSEQELLRREALKSLRKLGIDPYPAAEFEVTHTAKEIRENKSLEENKSEVTI